jgi:hypothetical protein
LGGGGRGGGGIGRQNTYQLIRGCLPGMRIKKRALCGVGGDGETEADDCFVQLVRFER